MTRLTKLYDQLATAHDPELVEQIKQMIRDETDYQAGVSEVEQIQAISAPGSDLREELYLQAELNAYNWGLD